MIYLNRQHKDYNVRMEILCMIPRDPVEVSVISIADDLGLERATVSYHITKLLTEGYRIRTQTRRHKYTRRAWLTCDDHDEWIVLRHNARIYYNNVYGDQKCKNRAISFPKPAA